jgi:hypothetical protein
MDELLASGIFLAVDNKLNFLFMNDDMIRTQLQRQTIGNVRMAEALKWSTYHKNTSFFWVDLYVEHWFALGFLVGENNKPLLGKLEDGMVYNDGLSMIMFHGDPMLRRVSEIIDRVVEAGIYNHLISRIFDRAKLFARKIALVHPLDEYYSFKMYHLQPAFYLLLIGWCLSSLCFMVELLYNRFLSKRK